MTKLTDEQDLTIHNHTSEAIKALQVAYDIANDIDGFEELAETIQDAIEACAEVLRSMPQGTHGDDDDD